MAAPVETKLYVTNFPSSATRQQLQQFFSRFGRVQECAIMWNSYAFVHYATMDEARRALDQSNGAMFLNRKLIVQLSTSRFRPQPKEAITSVSHPPEQLMLLDPSLSMPYHSTNLNPSSPNPLTSPYPYSDLLMASAGLRQHSSSSPVSDSYNFFRPPSPPTQDMINPYAQYAADLLQPNHINSNKNIKTDMTNHGDLPKLYCTNLPDNCTTDELQRLFSSFGHVIDCVILWDYYAFVTYKTFAEAERALVALNAFMWKDRHLIVEWSRASGRRQQQQQTSPSSTPPRLHSYNSEMSSPSSPRNRPSTLLTQSCGANNQFFGSSSQKVLPSPMKSHHAYNQNLALMSIIQEQQQSFLHHQQQHPYGVYKNGNSSEGSSNDTQQIFDSMTNHRLDLPPFIDANAIFSGSSELNTPSSTASFSKVYQPSDIAALLEPSPSDGSVNSKSVDNSINDITNTFSGVLPSCSSAAAAGAAALFQENLLSSLFNSFDPFNKLYPNENQPSSTASRYNHLSPLLTTAPAHSHSPLSYGHNLAWR